MLILELASNITLRLFLRPFEAVLSLKSLFERVPGGLQGSYFVWRAKMRNYYHLESSLEAVRPILKSEAAWGRSSDLEPPRPPYMILKWLPLVSGCQNWPRPRAASSDLRISKRSHSLEAGIKILRNQILFIVLKYEPNRTTGTLPNRIFFVQKLSS